MTRSFSHLWTRLHGPNNRHTDGRTSNFTLSVHFLLFSFIASIILLLLQKNYGIKSITTRIKKKDAPLYLIIKQIQKTILNIFC